MAYIIQNFELTTDLKYEDLKYNAKLMMEVEDGYLVKLHKRK